MREYQVLALDLSGHGDSGRRTEYPRDLWSMEVMGVARHAGVSGPPILVGHSMGGFVCINTAAQFGGDLAGVILVDSPVRRPDPEAEEGAHGTSFRNPKLYPTREKALARYRLVPEQPCENAFILDHIAETSVIRVENGWRWKFDPVIFRNVTPRATRELMPLVKCRVALIHAEFGLVTPDIGDYMYELLHRRAPVIEIPQAHHHLMLNQPLAFVSVLRTLLADWEHSIPAPRSR
jgi:pimeloyl-ACP methyl ester carboxylesterase